MSLSLRKIRLPLGGLVLELDAELGAPVTGIFGPSGAGKTSLLDLIAGLRQAESAFIALSGRTLTDIAAGISVATHQRAIGYVPQDLALFPHLDVRRNLLYGCKTADGSRSDDFKRVAEALEIAPLLERPVGALSGGEQQRVALARALLAAPRLLLLDEPLASLDRPLRARLLPFLRRIRDEFQVPMLYVSHAPEEIAALCDEILVLEKGRLIQQGPLSLLR